jgi:putative PIN family toxin of toxin-antitoxin system
MIWAVYDTNLVVSGTLMGGVPAQVMDLAVEGKVQLYSSEALIREFQDVISRPKHAARIEKLNYTVDQLIADYRSLVEIVQPQAIIGGSKDKDDNEVLACAVYANVDYIISGDKKHLLSMGNYAGIPIVSAAQFLQKFLSEA